MGDSKKSENNPLPPSWIDVALIEEALSNGGEENWIVASLTVRNACAAGDNYASSIYRVKPTLTDGGERSFIVKGPASGANMSSLAAESGFFQREVIMLGEILPQMHALLEEAAPGMFQPLAPRYYLHGTHPVEFLVLEDLAPDGFKLAKRQRGLGLRHSLLAMRNLARFHAASYALLQRQPGLNDKLDSGELISNQGMAVFLDRRLQAVANACFSWSGFEKYGEQIQKFKTVAMDTYAKLNDPIPGAFNVIVHGDFWVNNMMFSYEDGIPRENRFIDLQLSHVASPAIDILDFLSASVSEDVHIHHQDLLLREYHFALKETLEILGQQAPSLQSLLEAIDAHGLLALFVGLCGIPAVKNEGGADMNALFNGDSSVMAVLFEHPDVKRWMQRTIPDYDRRGWLPA